MLLSLIVLKLSDVRPNTAFILGIVNSSLTKHLLTEPREQILLLYGDTQLLYFLQFSF